MAFDSAAFLETLTQRAGVYQMFDDAGVLIYVGKARNLKKRVASYFRARGLNNKTLALVARIHNIEIIVTSNETEALLLEQTLIKKHRPQYNILLKDDKSYPFIHLSDHKYPLLSYKRGQRSRKGRYFGPYPNAYAVKESLNYLQKLFRIRNCEDSYFNNRSRACLQYQIKRCSGPCVGHISQQEYGADIHRAALFLEGKSSELIADLEQQMEAWSAQLEFEKAAQARDQLLYLRKLQEKQYVASTEGEADAWAVAIEKEVVAVQRISIRKGAVVNSKSYFPDNKLDDDPEQILFEVMAQFYLSGSPMTGFPETLLVVLSKEGGEMLCDAIRSQSQKALKWTANPRAERRRWLQMAEENAGQSALAKANQKHAYFNRLLNCQELLGLAELPHRIECFDISHSKGEATVASCVVFDKTGVRKDLYRRFNIRGITAGDDYGAIHQAVYRHFSRLKERQQADPENPQVYPAILLIDGAQGQVNKAHEALLELGIADIYILGISKGETRKSGWEFLWEQGESQPILPDAHDPGFLLLQEVRDEAHRFAITGHRKQRAKARITSGLEGIPGIGPKRRRELLRYFGSMNAIKGASIEEITAVPGINKELAKDIYAAFNGEL
jgi:excinuclease ABC subunit C